MKRPWQLTLAATVSLIGIGPIANAMERPQVETETVIIGRGYVPGFESRLLPIADVLALTPPLLS